MLCVGVGLNSTGDSNEASSSFHLPKGRGVEGLGTRLVFTMETSRYCKLCSNGLRGTTNKKPKGLRYKF